MTRYDFGAFSLELPAGWFDCTDEGSGGPFTLARADGVGALQLSVVEFRSGSPPMPSSAALLAMLQEAAIPCVASPAFDVVQEEGFLRLASASFVLHDSAFLRMWYLSDGLSFAKVTYNCTLDADRSEVPISEAIVRSLRFVGGTA